MTIVENEAAAAVNSDGQENQTPVRPSAQGTTPYQIPSSAWDLPPTLARALAYVALCLFEALETEPYEAPHGLDFKLRLFRNRMVRALSADQSGPGAAKTASPDLLEVAQTIVRYFTDPTYQEDQDRRAERATDGEVSFLEAVVCRLETAIQVTAAESAASTPAEAQERVAAKRAARLAGEVPA